MDVDLRVSRFDWAGGPAGIGPGVARVARTAEDIGVRALSFMDHFFQIDMLGPPEDPMLEGYTALGFVAGVTSALRLRLLVTGVTYRHPGILAKTIATLDVLSGGRAELGIGAAWFEGEHRALGVPFPSTKERFERLEETLQICLQMWSDDNGPYEGRHYRLAETLCVPAPLSRPHPPILVGGGRDYDRIEKTILAVRPALADVDGFLTAAAEYAALGVTEIAVMPDRHPVEFAAQVGEQVLPRLPDGP